MTDKEQKMYEIIRENPQISQNELAAKLGITRSAVSTHVSHLIKKGYIIGRQYILSEPSYVVVIGAANIDIVGRSTDPLIPEDSNPGSMEMCPGGVGRNVAENLARLGTPVKLITAIGNDSFGKKIVQSAESAGVDASHSYVNSDDVSSTYIAILDTGGEMKMALSDMRVLDKMPVEHLAKNQQIIKNAELIVTDAGLPEATLEYILTNFEGSRIFIDSVSVGKAKHAKRLIGRFDTVKTNRLEAEFLSDSSITDRASLSRIGEIFLKKGVKRVFITLGSAGAYYRTAGAEGIFPAAPIRPANATGAGDAFMAGVVYGTLKGWGERETARFSSAMSRIALMSGNTVSPLMSLNNVKAEMQKTEVSN